MEPIAANNEASADTGKTTFIKYHFSAPLAFTKPEEVSPDTERPGLLRAKTHPFEEDQNNFLEQQACQMRDLVQMPGFEPDLFAMGFDKINLAKKNQLQAVLQSIKTTGYLQANDAKQIRRLLLGRSFQLSHGKKMRVLFIAPEGFIMRKAGPNGLSVHKEAMSEMNGHEGATAVHGDQDVFGTPVKQILKGFAPKLFRHQSPDGANFTSPICLLNLWIPLQQITRPLSFMDRRSLQQKQQQLRYALPTDSFLDRSEDQELNDIWTFLYDKNQQWYCSSELNHQNAYVFDTLGQPHGACILPGEAEAEYYYRRLEILLNTIEQACNNDNGIDGDSGDKSKIIKMPTLEQQSIPATTPAALREALQMMYRHCLAAENQTLQQLQITDWPVIAQRLMEAVTRKSLEMRMLVWVS